MRLPAIMLFLATACVSTQPAPPAPSPSPAPAPAPAETRPVRSGSVPILSNGLSCDAPVAINTSDEREGIAKEKAWIEENYPGAKMVSRSPIRCNDKAADRIDLETANGQKRSIFFDSSKWAGK